ncbi:Queuine tRNA-ribosyltransferase accessory subunit 2 [Eumeta japonica]|uniref:Queuine tRNA-ribosyltransferase accessory subunit 2 n=1 Tax=Eumeta variegata TaxID=151549 RepID=A0A4C2A0V2_EUMVA|nr:Queuine tRNA-ribosyltransferase accessory subunit 2 [Eumeta japonica]
MEAFKPEIVLTVADSLISFTDGIKRVSKSVDRTCSMLEICIKRYQNSPQLQNTALVGVIVGSDRKEQRERCLNRIIAHKDTLRGVALSGLTAGGPKTHKITVDLMEPVFKETCSSLPPELFRILEGCWNPVVTLAAVAYGFDIFDGSYPAKLTNIGHALTLHFTCVTENNTDDLCILNLNDTR